MRRAPRSGHERQVVLLAQHGVEPALAVRDGAVDDIALVVLAGVGVQALADGLGRMARALTGRRHLRRVYDSGAEWTSSTGMPGA